MCSAARETTTKRSQPTSTRESSPHSPQSEKILCSNEDPAQPINKEIKLYIYTHTYIYKEETTSQPSQPSEVCPGNIRLAGHSKVNQDHSQHQPVKNKNHVIILVDTKSI